MQTCLQSNNYFGQTLKPSPIHLKTVLIRFTIVYRCRIKILGQVTPL